MTITVKDGPGQLFARIMREHQLKHDAALARFLELQPPVISKIRNSKLAVSAETILRVHDKAGYSIDKIRALIAL
jgi:plasmid maintenance system antidote protein VapI